MLKLYWLPLNQIRKKKKINIKVVNLKRKKNKQT